MNAAPGAPRPRYGDVHWAILAAFLVFVCARYMQWGARRAIFETIRIEFTLGLMLSAVCIGVLMSAPVDLRPARGVLAGIGLLFVAMLVQLPFAADPVMAKSVFVDRVIKFAFLTFFMTTLIRSPSAMRWFIAVFLFSCFYVTQEAVRGLISGSLVWENQGVMRLHGAVPIYRHPNSLGGVAMGAVPFVVFLLPVVRRWYLRAALLALLATSLTCVIYSGSRTAYIALLAFLAFWLFSSRRKGRWLAWATVLGAITLAVIPQQYIGRFESIGGQGGSKVKRIEILQDAWEIFLENPAGIGIASFPALRMQKFGRSQDTHNLYLEVATNLGVQGFVVFMLLIWQLLASYRATQRRLQAERAEVARLARAGPPPALARALRRHDGDLRFLAACCTAAAGFIYVRLALGVFGMDLYEVYWWFASGLAIALSLLAAPVARNTRRLRDAIGEAAA